MTELNPKADGPHATILPKNYISGVLDHQETLTRYSFKNCWMAGSSWMREEDKAGVSQINPALAQVLAVISPGKSIDLFTGRHFWQ